MFQARYYDPTSRFFLSPDPLRMVGVDDVFEHGKLQPYIFGGASPISFADLAGLKPVPHKECMSFKIGGVSATKRIETALRNIRRYQSTRAYLYGKLKSGYQRKAAKEVRQLMNAKRTLPIRCTRFDKNPAMEDAKGAFGARVSGRHEFHIDPRAHTLAPEHSLSDTIVHEMLHVLKYTHAEGAELTKRVMQEVADGAALKVKEFFDEISSPYSQKFGTSSSGQPSGSGTTGGNTSGGGGPATNSSGKVP